MLIVKNTLTVTRLDNYMDENSATIWVRVGEEGKNSLRVGGIYREHHILGEDNQNMTNHEVQLRQEERWRVIVKNWKAASKNRNCLVIGDLNLDYLKWNSPDYHQEEMTNLIQQQIESIGYIQVIDTMTRAWENQTESLIDHVWLNCPRRLHSHLNTLRTISDHNIVGANISLRDIKTGGHNILRRKWKKFRPSRYIEKLKQIDWATLYSETNPDTANTMFEKTITGILDSEAPMGIIQERVNYSCWLEVQTRAAMLERDISREVARAVRKHR